ncbi:MAG TPA: glycerophosphodiester phosphodiesterase family protein [Gemmatimonadaceae bacterium]|nr:glycerophosphodiester phosphodiesterase family protein [Gemmatimonadaceae bacterium]
MTAVLRGLTIVALGAALAACTEQFAATVPQWPNGGDLSGTRPLTAGEKQSLEGVYVVTQANGQFGDTLVLRWNGEYLGVYAGVHTAYMIMQAGATYDSTAGDSIILVQGYWGWMSAATTGLAQMTTPLHPGGAVAFTGAYGSGDAVPANGMKFQFLRPIYQPPRPFYLISHHGSGGAPELLPASENSVEIAKIIERYGANAIEIDTRPSLDSIPVLFHDNAMTPRLTEKGSLEGPVENYTYAQLYKYVRLVHGEHIPTLAAFLDTVIVATNIEFVYVDMKPTTIDFLPIIVQVQQAALMKASLLHRNVHIYLALTSDDILNKFITLPHYQDIPTICELSIDQLEQAGSLVWSPRFTQQIPTSDIDQLHGEGKLVITWTVDVNDYLQTFIEQGNLDGVLTDYLPLASYYYYKQ